jgi:hypothetical protein
MAAAHLLSPPIIWAKHPWLSPAVMLVLDYLLNVCVAIAAGIGALVSAILVLQPYVLTVCLAVLLLEEAPGFHFPLSLLPV